MIHEIYYFYSMICFYLVISLDACNSIALTPDDENGGNISAVSSCMIISFEFFFFFSLINYVSLFHIVPFFCLIVLIRRLILSMISYRSGIFFWFRTFSTLLE